MLHVVQTTILIVKRTPLLCGILFAAVITLLPISATAQCANWDAGGEWSISQRGQLSSIYLTMMQKGRVITGKAEHWIDDGDGGRRKLHGVVDGTIDGDSFSVQIFWNNDATGVYNGKVLPSGRLDGQAYEKNTPKILVTWHSDGVLKCSPPPPVKPKPIRSSGKAKPAPTSAPPPKPPFINAGRPIVIPHLPYAIVHLGWDGGPDNPNVEVFLSIDNGPQTPAFSVDFPPGHPLFKQPKVASIELKLQKGRLHKFVLKAGGATLSTVSFVAQ
jgi:hypothetical protein